MATVEDKSQEVRRTFLQNCEQNVCWALWTSCVQLLAAIVQFLALIIQSTPTFARLIGLVGFKKRFLECSDDVSFKKSPKICFKRRRRDPLLLRLDYFLPSRPLHDLDRLTIVLDLDETLVCSYESVSLPSFLKNQSGIRSFELQCFGPAKDGSGKPKGNHVTVFERPGLLEFLAKISEFAEVIIFTAGLEGYARPLIDRIDPKGYISARLYRPATVSTKYGQHVKDLSCLARDLCRTVIVDNNPFSFLLQPLNGIPCVPFTGGQSHDNQLLQVLLPLLRHLATQKDVRPVLSQKYHMPTWFQRHGIPASDWPI
eukprot:TRINITY_DN8668_c0_g1_i2.p1 TRINITY_DN8668_c0_g1~~TRINITY_DN8668_c0_g1_i2.p1  ORF type:complete len:314 (+),score=37.02 TRINITY_DN8668_c0_g1_i2:473-1414(+)